LMGSVGTLMGSIGMQLIALPWRNTLIALGIMTMGTASVSLLAWPFVIKRVIRLPGPNALSLPKSDLADA